MYSTSPPELAFTASGVHAPSPLSSPQPQGGRIGKTGLSSDDYSRCRFHGCSENVKLRSPAYSRSHSHTHVSEHCDCSSRQWFTDGTQHGSRCEAVGHTRRHTPVCMQSRYDTHGRSEMRCLVSITELLELYWL